MENNETTSPNNKPSSFLSRTLSSKRDRSNSVGKGHHRKQSPSPPPLPTSTTQNLQLKYSPQSSSPKSDDSPQPFPLKDLPSGALGKPRDRTTFKGVFDKFVGSFNGKQNFVSSYILTLLM